MTRTSAGTSKILRVAIIQGGKIVEERHVRRPDSVSVDETLAKAEKSHAGRFQKALDAL